MFCKTTTAVLTMAIALSSAPVQAQVVIDVAKITCDQYVRSKIASPDDIGLWLSGYYHSQRGSQTLDLSTLQANAKKLLNYCIVESNSNVPVVTAVEKLIGTGK
jgi:hypothetical protein